MHKSQRRSTKEHLEWLATATPEEIEKEKDALARENAEVLSSEIALPTEIGTEIFHRHPRVILHVGMTGLRADLDFGPDE